MLEVCTGDVRGPTMSLRVLSIAAIVIGFVIEIVFAGAQVGNGIAAVGIIVFVYDYFKKRQGPKF